MQIVKYIILSLTFFLSLTLSAQTAALISEDELAAMEYDAEVESRILEFKGELEQIYMATNVQGHLTESRIVSGSYTRILKQKLQIVSDRFMSVNYRWATFTQSEQAVIANNEHLLELMAQTELFKQALADTIESQKNKCKAIDDFLVAERLILSQDSVYTIIYKKAFNLSLVKKFTPQLEKLKVEEQAHFSKIQNSYNQSKAAVELVPLLENRATTLNEQYFKIQALSGKIQAMEYKPIVQRLKDYLLEIACVSVILMFFTMIVSKLKAAKKARQMYKQQAEMFKRTQGTDYPTI